MDDDIRNRYRRDYTNEVIRPPRPHHQPVSRPQQHPAPHNNRPAEPASHQPASAQHHSVTPRPKKRRRMRIILILLILLAAAGAGGYWYMSNKLSSPIPANIRASVSFPLLYPSKLPAGYHLDNNSFSSSGGVVLYSAQNGSGTKIAFTVQQRPSGFDFNNFYKQGLTNPSTFDTSLGQAALGTTNGRPLGSLLTDKSWLLVSSASKSVQSDDLRLILNNLKLSAR